MSNVVSLTVHKNTLSKRTTKELRKKAQKDLKLVMGDNACGYVLISFNDRGQHNCAIKTGNPGIVNKNTLPLYVYGVVADTLISLSQE